MNATFGGNVLSVEGTTVTITVTHPDQTKETLTAKTLADMTFSVSKPYDVAGAYQAQAHVDADSKYTAWDSDVKSFNISLTTRTGNFNVTLS